MDIYVIDTPLQLLNAIEARHHFASERSLLVILTSPPFPKRLFAALIDGQLWDAFIWVQIRDQSPAVNAVARKSLFRRKGAEYYEYFRQFRRRQRLNEIARSHGRVKKLFVGNYFQEYMRHFANQVDCEELLLLDDGTDALRVNEARRQLTGTAEGGAVVKLKSAVHRLLHDWNSRQAASVTFFTVYDIASKSGDRVVRNEYRHLRASVADLPAADHVLFLGQCLVDDGWMSEENYLAHLTKVGNYYQGRRLVYVRHPRESESIIGAVRCRLNWEVVRYNLPIECQLAREGAPNEIASFFCSALDNCRLIFGQRLQVTAFYVDPEDLICCREFVTQMYAYWRKRADSHFRVAVA
jgi:hypothetical protein